MVEVWLPYGRTEVCVRVPTKNLLHVIEPNEKAAAARNPDTEIEDALTNPLGTKRLAETVKHGDKVAIALMDSGTSTNQVLISTILKELITAGIRYEDITVIGAYDPFHVPPTQGYAPLLGGDLFSGVTAIRHDCQAGEHVHVGTTSRGTEVHLNKTFAEADVKVVAGVVEPHLFAGYSGGREGVLPGVSSAETIRQNLLLSLDKKAGIGLLEDNPVHDDMVEAAHLAEVDFSLNVVRNTSLEVVKAFAGSLDLAFEEAVKLVDEIYRVPIESRADAVFVSPGGSVFDANLFQACKSLDAALEATRKGKVVILVAECTDGYGTGEFYEAVSTSKDSRSLEKSLRKHFTEGGLMAHHLLTSLQSAKIILVSVIPDSFVSKSSGMETARTANEALRSAFETVGKNGRVSLIPYGNLTMPLLKAAE